VCYTLCLFVHSSVNVFFALTVRVNCSHGRLTRPANVQCMSACTSVCVSGCQSVANCPLMQLASVKQSSCSLLSSVILSETASTGPGARYCPHVAISSHCNITTTHRPSVRAFIDSPAHKTPHRKRQGDLSLLFCHHQVIADKLQYLLACTKTHMPTFTG